MGESCVRDGTMFPSLMVIDAVVYFGDVFTCHSQLTESCCNHKKLNKEALLFICLSSHRSSNMARYIMERCSGSSSFREHEKYISPKIREQDLTSASRLRLNLSLLPCRSSLLSSSLLLLFLLFLYICPSPSFSSPSFLSLSPGVRPQHKFIGGGGMPVEVKRVSGSPSASPIILYG